MAEKRNNRSIDLSVKPTIRRCELQWRTSPYFAVLLENLFTAEECAQLLQDAQEHGFETALVNVGGGRQILATDYRNSERCIVDDPVKAEWIWQRILTCLGQANADTQTHLRLDLLQTPKRGWSPVGLNERLRFLKYRPGHFFRPHPVGSYVRDDDSAGKDRVGEQSFVTGLVYLNDCLAGGETAFHGPTDRHDVVKVPCRTGSVLLFQHDLIHEGCEITAGTKYVIRTDVMYSRKGRGHESSVKPIIPRVIPNASDSFDEAMDCSIA